MNKCIINVKKNFIKNSFFNRDWFYDYYVRKFRHSLTHVSWSSDLFSEDLNNLLTYEPIVV